LHLASRGAFNPTHPCTRLCLDLLKEVLAVAPVRSFLDLGCGAGVLGLAAAALGVPRVVGVDLARDAARITRENARANGLAGQIAVLQGSSESLKGPFDLAAANLHLEVQLQKAEELERLAATRGRLILSGFRENQEEALLAVYRERGWSLGRRLVKGFSHPELPRDLSFTWAAWLLARGRGSGMGRG